MGCCECIVKYSLFFFNMVFTLAGLALIAIGVGVHVNLKKVTEVLPVDLTLVTTLVIVVGCIVFIIAFSGCCGAVGEYRCLLVLYAVFLIILAAGLTYVAVMLLGNIEELKELTSGWVETAFENNKPTNETGPGIFQGFEEVFQCCGVDGYQSYDYLPIIPGTCCAEPVNMVCAAADTYGGCRQLFTGYLTSYSQSIGLLLVCIISIKVIAIIFALYLNHTITRNRRANKYY